MILEAIREGKTRGKVNTDFGGDVQLVDMLFLFLIHNHYITNTPITTENKSGWEMTVKGTCLLRDFGKKGIKILNQEITI